MRKRRAQGALRAKTENRTAAGGVIERDRIVRGALWASVPFNLLVAAAFAVPDSALGQWAGLPPAVPRVYGLLLAFFVALFGGAYAWIASQSVVHRPMVAFSAIGKGGAFAIFLLLWLAGDVPGRGAALAGGDLLLAAIFAWWTWWPASKRVGR